MNRQTTRTERSNLKYFLENGNKNTRTFIVTELEIKQDSNRVQRALNNLKDLFSEEDFQELEQCLKYNQLIDFKLKVSEIYTKNFISLKTFKRVKHD